ncbi:uncharacterized protein [Ptychodera flava]|uniref:uncharacterized protein isoform X2 n=1 Tax=Ptychodera flava TaxID=63121 RepID=UPI00396A5243
MATEVGATVYEGWLEKCGISSSDGKSKGKFLQRKKSVSWKKLYFILRKERDNAKEYSVLAYYDKKPQPNEDSKDTKGRKGVTKLWPHYKIEKVFTVKDRSNVFMITTEVEKFQLYAESPNLMDLWVFHLQTQTKLRNDLPGSSFIVKALESAEHRRIGSIGNNCLLHISPWGITLALQNSRSLVGQWPLKCIRTFESSDNGRFTFEAGRSSPMGQGEYAFLTKPTDDNALFDLIDNYTIKNNQRHGSSVSSSRDNRTQVDDITEEYDRLRLATFGLLPSQKAAEVAASASPCINVPGGSPRQRPVLKQQHSTLSDEVISEEQDEAGYMRPSPDPRLSQVSQTSTSDRPAGQRLIRSQSEMPPISHHKDSTGTYLDMSRSNLNACDDEPWWAMSGEFKSPPDSMSPEIGSGDRRQSVETHTSEQRKSTGAIPKQTHGSSHPYEDMASPGTSYENALLPVGNSYENSRSMKAKGNAVLTAYENEGFVSSPHSFTKSLPKRFQLKENNPVDTASGSGSKVVYTQVQHSVKQSGAKPPPYLEIEDNDEPLTSPKLARSASYDNLMRKMSVSPDTADRRVSDIVPGLPEWMPNRRLPAPPPGTVNLNLTHSYLDIDIQGNKTNGKTSQKIRKHNYEDIEDNFAYEFVQRKTTLSRSRSDPNLLADVASPPPVPNTPRPSLRSQRSQERNGGHSVTEAAVDTGRSKPSIERQVSGNSVTSQDEQASSSVSLSKIKSPLGMKIKTSKKTKTFTKRSEEIEVTL